MILTGMNTPQEKCSSESISVYNQNLILTGIKTPQEQCIGEARSMCKQYLP